MPGMDGSGHSMGYGLINGGRRGSCVGATDDIGFGANAGRGAGRGRSRGSAGRGRRNQFYATGLTGWQRAEQADSRAPACAWPDPFASLESRLGEIVERLDRLEAGQK